MSRAVVYEKFGGPEVLELREVPEPHAGPGEVRVRVTAAGLNPMDWSLASNPEAAARFGITLPSGFGYDFAGVVDEAGPGAKHAVGDRVFGGVLGRAVADFVVARADDALFPTPDGLGDEVASTLPVAGSSAAAALAAVGLRAGDTLLVGGAAGGVGIFAVQLARLAGATVIGTAAEGTFPFLRKLGAEPVAYGPGLAGRLNELTAAVDLFGTEAAEAALRLGVPPERIATIAAGPHPPGGMRATGGADAEPGTVPRIAAAVVAGELTVPVAAVFPVERIRDAVTLQAARHVHGKVVVTLWRPTPRTQENHSGRRAASSRCPSEALSVPAPPSPPGG